MHREETLPAEDAPLQAELVEAPSTSMISNIGRSNRVQVAEAHLVELADLRLQVKALKAQPSVSTQHSILNYLKGQGKISLAMSKDLRQLIHGPKTNDALGSTLPDTPYMSK